MDRLILAPIISAAYRVARSTVGEYNRIKSEGESRCHADTVFQCFSSSTKPNDSDMVQWMRRYFQSSSYLSSFCSFQ